VATSPVILGAIALVIAAIVTDGSRDGVTHIEGPLTLRS